MVVSFTKRLLSTRFVRASRRAREAVPKEAEHHVAAALLPVAACRHAHRWSLRGEAADPASCEKRSAAMLVVAIDAAGMPESHMLTGHREPALLAQLRPFPHHAGGNFWHVRDKIRTKPHGIAGAGLACVVAGLSSGLTDAGDANSNNHKTHRQSRAADKTQNT